MSIFMIFWFHQIIKQLIYDLIVSDNPLSVPDVDNSTQTTNIVDTKDIVQISTMADITEVKVEDTSDLKPSFIVCEAMAFLIYDRLFIHKFCLA